MEVVVNGGGIHAKLCCSLVYDHVCMQGLYQCV